MKIFNKKIDLRDYLKTKCGIDTFDRLRTKRGIVNRLRFIQFTICALVVDIFKRNHRFDD